MDYAQLIKLLQNGQSRNVQHTVRVDLQKKNKLHFRNRQISLIQFIESIAALQVDWKYNQHNRITQKNRNQ